MSDGNGNNELDIDDFGEVTPELHRYMDELIAQKREKGFPFSYMEDKDLIREYPDGRRYILRENNEGDIVEIPYNNK